MADIDADLLNQAQTLEDEHKKKKESKPKSEKKKKQKVTFNDLDEKYQTNETMDPDHIFEDEKKLIDHLRKRFPVLGNTLILCFF